MTRRKSLGKTGAQNGRLESMNATYDLQLGIEMIPAEGPTRNLKPQTLVERALRITNAQG